jgi:hypothetical protein
MAKVTGGKGWFIIATIQSLSESSARQGFPKGRRDIRLDSAWKIPYTLAFSEFNPFKELP